MTDRLSEKQIDALIAAYLAGSLSAAALPLFERWLKASPNNPRRVARLSVTDYALREVCQDTKSDYLLDILNQIDDAAGPAQLVTLHNFQQPIWHRYRLPMALGGAIAAVLVIAITLIMTLSGPASDPASIAGNSAIEPNDSIEPGPVGPALTNPVATITAEHNAVWDQKPHEHLRAGQRLTLTAGFAEITTHRGAIAIIEAPATIEFTNNDNALQLHSGKLVGICETPSSKGFVVRTPHLDVFDLGTRFGVDATDTAATSVHVIDGLVEAAQRSQITGQVATRQVTKEQALVATADGFSTTAFQPERFAAALRTPGQPIAVPGDVAWHDHPLRELKESEELQIYTEKTGLILKEDLAIDIDGKGNRPTTREPDALTIPAGTAVDVYLLNLDTPGHEERIGSFTLRFDRPILGVIGRGERLDQTDALFVPGTPKRNGGSARGAIEDLNKPDLISADGRTLQLTLRVAATTDQLRVLVAAENN